ncbi:hypothetical protein POTOM_060468 [Populus tomentosa]|uniref:Uncharacterized protein n=1 Tax=Populus tomentosa TaxID=118781 RepID=A0A8X8C0D7_POPTO|nr:hypothetical protein POTOM_060468 [Populus tomentosa]
MLGVFPKDIFDVYGTCYLQRSCGFMKAAAAVCQLESSGGRTFVVLSKEKEKEKDKSKASGAEESVRISESKMHDGSGKCAKGHKKIPANLTQVIDQLLDIVLKYPLQKSQEGYVGDLNSMDVDEPATKLKGKSKVDEAKKTESESEISAGLAKVNFVLKLLSDILLMYVHAVGVILRRDLELCHLRGSNQTGSSGLGGIIHHILHQLLPIATDKSAGPDEWRDKLSEKASWFLVFCAVDSGFGKPVKGSANASEQVLKSEGLNRKNYRAQMAGMMNRQLRQAAETVEHNQNVGGTQEVPDEEETDIQQQEGTTHVEGNHAVHQNESVEQDMRLESEGHNGNQPINGGWTGFHALKRTGRRGDVDDPFLLSSQAFGVFDRRRQSGRSSLSVLSQKDLELCHSGSFDVASFLTLNAPVLPYEHVPSSIFVDRSGSAAPPPLSDYSVVPEFRSAGEFNHLILYPMMVKLWWMAITPATSNLKFIRIGNEDTRYQPNPTVETVPCNEQYTNGLDNMEIGDGDGTACDQVETMPELANSSAEQHAALHYEGVPEVPASRDIVARDAAQADQTGLDNGAPATNAIDPTFLEAYPKIYEQKF